VVRHNIKHEEPLSIAEIARVWEPCHETLLEDNPILNRDVTHCSKATVLRDLGLQTITMPNNDLEAPVHSRLYIRDKWQATITTSQGSNQAEMSDEHGLVRLIKPR